MTGNYTSSIDESLSLLHLTYDCVLNLIYFTKFRFELNYKTENNGK